MREKQAMPKLKMVTWHVDYTINGHKIKPGYDWTKDPNNYKVKMKVKDMGIVISRPFNRCFHCGRRYVDSDNKGIAYCGECDIMLASGGEEFLRNYNQSVTNCRVPIPDNAINYNWDTVEPFEMTDEDCRKVDKIDIRKAIDAKFTQLVMDTKEEENLPNPADVTVSWDEYIEFNLRKANIRKNLREEGQVSSNFQRADTL